MSRPERFRLAAPEMSETSSEAENLESVSIDSFKGMVLELWILTTFKPTLPRGSKKRWSGPPSKRRSVTSSRRGKVPGGRSPGIRTLPPVQGSVVVVGLLLPEDTALRRRF